MKIRNFFPAFFIFCSGITLLYSCDESESHPAAPPVSSTVKEEAPKPKQEPSQTDEIMDGVEKGVELVKDFSNDKKRKDSIRNENKTRMWVFVIGNAYNNIDRIGEEVDKLKEIGNIYVFKKTRNEYYLVKDDGYRTREALEEVYGDVMKSIQALSSSRVQMVDLSLKCSAKTEPTISKPIRYKTNGKKSEADCIVCD